MGAMLEFEKPIAELEKQIDELKKLAGKQQLSVSDDLQPLETKLAERKRSLHLPEENLLYFLEKNSLILEPWQREIIRIVRIIAQYFYPQRQTQVMNEGCATFVHYTIMNTLFDRGQIHSSQGTA